MSDVKVIFDEAARGKLTVRDLLRAIGTLAPPPLAFYRLWDLPPGRRTLFGVFSEGFSFELFFIREHRGATSKVGFGLRRNEYEVFLPLIPDHPPAAHIQPWARWDPESITLSCSYYGETHIVQQVGKRIQLDLRTGEDTPVKTLHERKITGLTIVPGDLLAWARRQSLWPVDEYETKNHVFEAVVDAFQAIGDKVDVSSVHQFWDFSYEAGRIVSRRPKREEPDLQSAFAALIHDVCLQKSLLYQRGCVLGNGKLDFLVTGRIRGGEDCSICVECKPAHNRQIVHGLSVQLPSYMQKVGTAYGLYVIAWFKGRWFNEPGNYEGIGELALELDKDRWIKNLGNVRIVVLDLSSGVPPSQLRP